MPREEPVNGYSGKKYAYPDMIELAPVQDEAADWGTIVDVRPYAFDGGSDAILEASDRIVRWRSVTALDDDGLTIEYDAPEDARFTLRSPVTTFDFRPADVGREPLIVEAGPVDRRVTVSRVPAQPGPRAYSFDFTDDLMPSGTSAYYVRLVQDDDEKAWSSPIYVTRAHEHS